MAQRMTLEVIAATVDEAVEKGLDQLGLEPDDVEIEVLDEGKRNFFSFASRQARIKLTVKNSPVEAAEKITDSKKQADELPSETVKKEEVPLFVGLETEELVELNADESIEEFILKTVKTLLAYMKVSAVTTVEKKLSEDDDREYYRVEVEGDDLSLLIGRRAETLNAIQYMVSLIVTHHFGNWIRIQVDIQNYRSRRELELQKLARRMADQVISTGRKQMLEPMPANERRIVHIELRKRDDVYTESVGEEPNRKIYIYPAD
ncbi:MAG: Jag N-terminal domain-containing protein [Anaerolineaceae bacterium]|nr:Jag N-terminal domain-containing protein [Anaerolineaceae bacterium]